MEFRFLAQDGAIDSMTLLHLYRLVEVSGGMGRFFLLRDVFVPDRPFIRHRLVRATGDRRFLLRSLGLDPRKMRRAGSEDWRPQGPGLRTLGAWHVTGDDGSSGSIFEVEMPASATDIRTGTTPDHRDPFDVGGDYSDDQVTAGGAGRWGQVISYPVGPGIDAPLGIKPHQHGVNVDLKDMD